MNIVAYYALLLLAINHKASVTGIHKPIGHGTDTWTDYNFKTKTSEAIKFSYNE